MNTETQIALVVADGLGGVVLLDGPDHVKTCCKNDGSPEVFYDLSSGHCAGVYKVCVRAYRETCDCSDGYPCSHDGYIVTETGASELISSDLSFALVSDRDRAETELYTASLQSSESMGLSTESTASITGECAKGGKRYETAMILEGDSTDWKTMAKELGAALEEAAGLLEQQSSRVNQLVAVVREMCAKDKRLMELATGAGILDVTR